jgi:hypothetical protein
MFETSPLHVARPDDFLSNEDIKLITLPKRFSRDVGVLESQLRSMLDSVINLRPINRRYVTMPGLKNVIGNGRNLTSKGVKNICYLNASIFFLSSIDTVVDKAYMFLKSHNPSFTIEDLLENSLGRSKTKSPSTKAVITGKSNESFLYNMCVVLVAMRSKNLKSIVLEKYNYRHDRIIIDSTLVASSFYKEVGISEADQGNKLLPYV